jgi:hypothetical protein
MRVGEELEAMSQVYRLCELVHTVLTSSTLSTPTSRSDVRSDNVSGDSKNASTLKSPTAIRLLATSSYDSPFAHVRLDLDGLSPIERADKQRWIRVFAKAGKSNRSLLERFRLMKIDRPSAVRAEILGRPIFAADSGASFDRVRNW